MGEGHRRSVGARPRVELGFSARPRRQARSAHRSATPAATGEARQRPATRRRRRRRRDLEDLDHGCGNHSGLQDRPSGRAWGRPAAAEPCSRQVRQPPTPRHLTRDIAPGPSPHPPSQSRPCRADQAPSDAPRQAQRAVPVTCGLIKPRICGVESDANPYGAPTDPELAAMWSEMQDLLASAPPERCREPRRASPRQMIAR